MRLLGVASEEEDAVAAHHGLKMGYSGASARIHDSDPTSLRPAFASQSVCEMYRRYKSPTSHLWRVMGENPDKLKSIENSIQSLGYGRYPPIVLVGVSINEILKLSFPG